MKIPLILPALALALGAFAQEPEPKPDPKPEPAKVQAEISKTGKLWVFKATVKTELKDSEPVSFRVYYVKRYKLPPGLVEPGGPDFDEDLVEVDGGSSLVSDGEASVTCGYSDLDPWPGDYRILAWWGNGRVGDYANPSGRGDFTTGKMEDFTEMRAQVDRELYEDFARIGRVLGALRKRWLALGKEADAGWADWRKEADAAIANVKTRNAKRRKADIYWAEARGRQRVDWVLQKVNPTLDMANQYFKVPEAQRPPIGNFENELLGAEEDWQRYLDFLGIGKIIDDAKVRGTLKSLAELADSLDAWRARVPKEVEAWRESGADTRTRILELQMLLTGELSDAYFGKAQDIQKAALRLVSHVTSLAEGREVTEKWEVARKRFDDALEVLLRAVPRVPD